MTIKNNDKTIHIYGSLVKYTKEENIIIEHWANDNYDKLNYKDNENIKITTEDGKELEFEIKKNKKSMVIYI